MKPREKAGRNDEGVALLLTLLFIALLTVLVVEYVYETQVETSVVAASLNDFEALTAAKSAVNTGLSMLVSDALTMPGEAVEGSTSTQSSSSSEAISGGVAYDSLDEPWAYGVPFQELNNAVMECSISDEFGKLNLNALFRRGARSQTSEESPESSEPEYDEMEEADESLDLTLQYLFEERGAEGDVVDAILDWIDSDDDTRPNGAESDYYQSLSKPYSCKNGPISSVEELLLIRGITPELYFGDPELEQVPLSELLTVNGHRTGKINLNTAPYELLLALGEAIGMPGLAEIAIEERELSPFLSQEDIEARGVVPSEPEDNDRNEESGIAAQSNPFIVASSAFRLRGNGLAGEARVRIEAVLWRDVQMGAEGFRLLQWRELR